MSNELENREKAYMQSLEKIERVYILKLEELCRENISEEQTPDEISKELKRLTQILLSLEEQLDELQNGN